jgi:galactokinase/mevalonate kinase-like predicted kinase
LDLLNTVRIDEDGARALAGASEACSDAITRRGLNGFSQRFLESFHAQVSMFPKMLNPEIEQVIAQYKDKALAWKLTGAGAGGCLEISLRSPQMAPCTSRFAGKHGRRYWRRRA